MASLDFAFLAEFAKVEPSATVTAVGAGIRGITLVGEGSTVQLFVAGGVDRDRGEGEASLTITVEPPAKEYSISQSAIMEPAPVEGAYATTVFAIAIVIPIVASGRYQLLVSVNDQVEKTLDLWVTAELPPDTDLPDGA